MITKRYTAKTVKIVENNAKSIPFDEYFSDCTKKYNVEASIRNEILVADWRHKHAARVKELLPNANPQEFSEGEAPVLSNEDIREIARTVYKETATSFADTYGLKARSSWLPVQLMAHFGKLIKPVEENKEAVSSGSHLFSPHLFSPKENKEAESSGSHLFSPKESKENNEHLFSPKATVDALLGSADNWDRGAFLFIKHAGRSDWIGTQYKDPDTYYSALVPFFLAAVKKYQNIPYSAWSKTDLSYIVEPNLCEAMLAEVPPDLDSTELLEIRELGMQIKSGKQAGSSRNPLTTYKLWGCAGTAVGKLPWLAQVMLTQVWCAHPSARNEYMVLDPSNWDNMPSALISTDILSSKNLESPKNLGAAKPLSSKINATLHDIPWI